MDLKNLLKHLKRFEDLELIYEDLKKYGSHQDVLDIQQISSANTAQLRTFSMRAGIDTLPNVEDEDTKKLNTGLCIIISQMFFESRKVYSDVDIFCCIKFPNKFNNIYVYVYVYK